ncbi:hypothetical protein ORF158 [Pyrococcus abyssi virus 1]|uniref:hypothetical protein n=1 Tax=Pyrococcus abyssi virus 1 TaxID=425386 RepID=UPI00015529B8|nr:hypothetical protein PAV1_ORF158 [Pyrococcus abyssi virus 1]ABN58495.1 hypothetical protein ORF158 [Pyrococcus abyssi virus 1]
MFGLGKGKRESSEQEVSQKSQSSQKSNVATSVIESILKSAPTEPVLQHFERFKDKVPADFAEWAEMVTAPAHLLGIADYSSLADVIIELELLGLGYKCHPEFMSDYKYDEFRLFLATVQNILNVAEGGKLLMAETRFIFPDLVLRASQAQEAEEEGEK